MPHREIVASHFVEGAARARPEETAGGVLARLALDKPANLELVLVTDEESRLHGVVPIEKLIASPAQAKLEDIASHAFPSVGPDTDQERAASLALHHGVDALPVVDAGGRALGVMPSQALLQILRREHVEDLHRLAGIEREAAQARHAIEDPPLRRLSLTHAALARLLAGELRTGMLLGAVLGVASFFPVWIVFGEPRLAAAVATRRSAADRSPP